MFYIQLPNCKIDRCLRIPHGTRTAAISMKRCTRSQRERRKCLHARNCLRSQCSQFRFHRSRARKRTDNGKGPDRTRSWRTDDSC